MAASSVHFPFNSSLVQLQQQVFIPPIKSNKEKGRVFFSHCHRQPAEPPPRAARCTYNNTLPHIPHLYSGPYTITTSISFPKIKDGGTLPEDLVEKTKKTPDLFCPTTTCGFPKVGQALPCGELISFLVILDPPLTVLKPEMLRPREAELVVTARVHSTTNGSIKWDGLLPVYGPANCDDFMVTFGVGPLDWARLKVGLQPTVWTDIISVDRQQLFYGSHSHVLFLMSLEIGCLQCSCVDYEMGTSLPPPGRGLVSMPWKPPDYGHLACVFYVIWYYLFKWGTLSQLVSMNKICSPETLYPQVAQLHTRRVLVYSALPLLVYYWTGPQSNCYAWGLSPFIGGGDSVNGELEFVHDDGLLTNLSI